MLPMDRQPSVNKTHDIHGHNCSAEHKHDLSTYTPLHFDTSRRVHQMHLTQADVGATTRGCQHTGAGLVSQKVAHILAVGARVVVVLGGLASHGALIDGNLSGYCSGYCNDLEKYKQYTQHTCKM